MGKTISTFVYYFLISFLTPFFPEAFYASVKKLCLQNSVVPADGARIKVDFLERLHKMLREKTCDEWHQQVA